MSEPDPLRLIRNLPPGTVILGREHYSKGSLEVSWLIREQSAVIAQLGPSPRIGFRAGTPQIAGVIVTIIMANLGPAIPQRIYKALINGYDHLSGIRILGDLAIQPRILFHLVGDDGNMTQTVEIQNGLQEFSRSVLQRIQTTPAWSQEAFERVVGRLNARYPNDWALWEFLKVGGAGRD